MLMDRFCPLSAHIITEREAKNDCKYITDMAVKQREQIRLRERSGGDNILANSCQPTAWLVLGGYTQGSQSTCHVREGWLIAADVKNHREHDAAGKRAVCLSVEGGWQLRTRAGHAHQGI